MIREHHADRSTEADMQRLQERTFEAWCKIGDPEEVAHARLVRRKEQEVADKAAAWLRKRGKKRFHKKRPRVA